MSGKLHDCHWPRYEPATLRKVEKAARHIGIDPNRLMHIAISSQASPDELADALLRVLLPETGRHTNVDKHTDKIADIIEDKQ